MIRCMKTSFRASKETIDRLFECNRVSGEVWNRCLELAKETHLKTGKWIIKSALQKGTKGSKQWKRYDRAKRYVLSKSDKQLHDALHKTTKQFVDWCIENEVKEVAFGDADGVQRNTSRRKKKKVRRRTTNQKLSNWSFGKVYAYLKYKLEAEGMKIDKHDESNTTRQCPCCPKTRKVSSRNYTCPCGYSNHRDIHGASNFFAKTFYSEIRKLDFSLQPTKYLRIA